MNKRYYIKNAILLAGLSMAILTSCSKFVEISKPVDQLVTAAVFSDSSSAESTLLGLYAQTSVFGGFLTGNVTLYPALSADEIYNTSTSATYDPYTKNELSPTVTLSWSNPYNIIYQCNTIIESLKGSSLTASQIKRLTGECKFMRALNYFYLTNLYGAVPLATTTDYRINSLLSRTDSAAVYTQIINDLKDAKNELDTTYHASGKVRANRWAAAALLARVYLYQKDYTNALAQSADIFKTNLYSLGNLSGVFLPNSSEAILQFIPPVAQALVTTEAYYFLPSSATVRPTFALRPGLLNAFSSADLRKNAWTRSNTVSGTVYYYPWKYKVRTVTAQAAKPEYNMVLRLAEQYLIRAEAFANQGDTDNAIKELDAIRDRAGLPLIKNIYPGIPKERLLDSIYRERQVELFTEWGHRWLDLKRTGRADAVAGALKPTTWQQTDKLYPIPNSDILQNPNLAQNPGYNK